MNVTGEVQRRSFLNKIRLSFLAMFLAGCGGVDGYMVGALPGMALGLLAGGAAFFCAWFFGPRWALSVWQAQRLSEEEAPEVFRIVRGLAQKCGLPAPALFLIPSAVSNAMSAGRGPRHGAIAVTAGLIRSLNEEELSAVLGHEMAHIENGEAGVSSAAAALAGALVLTVTWLDRVFILGEGHPDTRVRNPLVLLYAAVVIPAAAGLVRTTVFRSRVFTADVRAAGLCGNPLYVLGALHRMGRGNPRGASGEAGLASAHLFFSNPLEDSGFARLFGTHPAVEERVAKFEKESRPGPESIDAKEGRR